MTIIMGKDNKIKWFHGLLEAPETGGKPTDAVYGKNGLRKEILKRVIEFENAVKLNPPMEKRKKQILTKCFRNWIQLISVFFYL